MNFSNSIRNMLSTQKTASAKDYTIAELLTDEFIHSFTKFGSLEQFLQHTGLSTAAVINPGEMNDKKVNAYIKKHSAFRDLDHVLTVAKDYAVRLQMLDGMFK